MLSSIFKRFEEDFQGAGSLKKYLARHVDDSVVAQELARDGYRVERIDYGRSLDGQAPRQRDRFATCPSARCAAPDEAARDGAAVEVGTKLALGGPAKRIRVAGNANRVPITSGSSAPILRA